MTKPNEDNALDGYEILRRDFEERRHHMQQRIAQLRECHQAYMNQCRETARLMQQAEDELEREKRRWEMFEPRGDGESVFRRIRRNFWEAEIPPVPTGIPQSIWEEAYTPRAEPHPPEIMEQVAEVQQRISAHIHMHSDTQHRNTLGMGCGPAPVILGGYHVYQPNPDPASASQAEFVTVHFTPNDVFRTMASTEVTSTPAKPSTTEYRERLEAKGWTEIQEVRVGMQTQVWAVRPGGVCPEPINPEKEARDEV